MLALRGPLLKVSSIGSARSLRLPTLRWSSTKVSEPLRILFCGSDTFSCASLQALQDEHKTNPGLIKSIDVVTRPGKPTGRGMKTIREGEHADVYCSDEKLNKNPVPLKTLANELGLPIHERDTFTGWNPPRGVGDPINLIIAVSFGLFVPPRLLRAVKYGGLNVHPSLLPDFRGAAPLQHTLLAARTHTGISLQTLSEVSFDAGTVLAQTPLPGVAIPESCTLPQLHSLLAPLGAELLVRGLRSGVHVPPHQATGWQPSAAEQAALRPAPKITKADSEVPWRRTGGGSITPVELERRGRVLGPLWTRAWVPSPSAAEEDDKGADRYWQRVAKRVILEDLEAVECPAELLHFVRKAVEARRLSSSSGGESSSAAATSEVEDDDMAWVDGQMPADLEVGAVTFLAAVDAGATDGQKTAAFTVPFVIQGESVVIPLGITYSLEGSGVHMPSLTGQKAGLRIGRIKIEGDMSKPAARAIGTFAHDGSSRFGQPGESFLEIFAIDTIAHEVTSFVSDFIAGLVD